MTARTNPNPDRASASKNAQASTSTVVQPKPQALPKRTGPSSIIVSPRQKGNPILTNIKSMPWEYGDIPSDYILGLTTCCLFLSLKYHRLHPEYIYTRIQQLQGKYLLRIVLVMVDIQNHEESLKELSKTSLINNVTLVLTWSSAEGARYLELFKTYENAAPTAIKAHQSSAYADRMVGFITTPRAINKTDAVSLVSQFGSVRTAVNAREEDVTGIGGWGEKKVVRWCRAVREPFRVERAAKRGITRENTRAEGESEAVLAEAGSRALSEMMDTDGEADAGDAVTEGEVGGVGIGTADADKRPEMRLAEEQGSSVEESLFVPEAEAPVLPKEATIEASRKRKPEEDPLSDGLMAALSKLRKDGG